MKNTLLKLVALGLFILRLGNGVAVGSQTAEQAIRVGKTDDITLKSVTRVGRLTLQPGHYILQHRASHGEHAVHFVKFIPYGGGEPGKGRPYYPFGATEVGVQQCRLQALPTKVKQTHVFLIDDDGTKQITRIEIKGENVAHVF
jgi:hypothetical protein